MNIRTLLESELVLRVPALLCAQECRELVRAVYAARDQWTSAFDGEQFSLGRAWYTHLEDGLTKDYFKAARLSDECVERVLPGLRARLHGWLAGMLNCEVHQRIGWTGCGVHIFPASEKVARSGGSVHFDTEGLSSHHAASRKPALSLIVMIQEPESGGELRVWNQYYQGEHGLEEEPAGGTIVPYGVGVGVVQNCYRLHQIQPFSGSTDRLCLTLMSAEVDPGNWEVWF